jgi:hypothetical protein
MCPRSPVDSDVDILVEVDPSIGLDLVSLCNTIERLLGTRVDVVSSRAIRPNGWKVIESELIYVQEARQAAIGRHQRRV